MADRRELSKTRIYVDGLPSSVTKAQFDSLVSPFGKIKDLHITRTGKGFVEYETHEAAQYAIHALNSTFSICGSKGETGGIKKLII